MKKIKLKIDKDYKLPFILCAIIFSMSVLGFIVFSFGDLDYKCSGAMGILMHNYFIKNVALFYFLLGNSSMIFLVICVLVIIETIFYKKIPLKYNWMMWFIYLIIYAYWLYLKINGIITSKNLENDGTLGNFDFLVAPISHQIDAVVLFLFELIVVISTTYYMRFVMIKNKKIEIHAYWKDAVKMILIVDLTYFIVIILKQSTGRGEYFWTNFEDIIGKINWDSDHKYVKSVSWTKEFLDLANHGVNLDNLKAAIINNINKKGWGNYPYTKWWEINGNFSHNLQYWYPINMFIKPDMSTMPKGWDIINFPSGHVVTAFSFIGYGSMFLYNRDVKKSWIKNSFTIVWILHILMMMTMLVIGRVHWLTDVFFTAFLVPLMIIFTNYVFNKIEEKYLIRKNKKSQYISS
ncbi:phosphatase PAP2 family protein [Spiroplasma endosymbiont of Aspidapion aeneum]|uniref:phosphatase PAP2 family protein n=1 Tax=Spiroplasma endosymbiont of Aspidapion aeneum TaxID=3066276 RepID=UPI00313C965D